MRRGALELGLVALLGAAGCGASAPRATTVATDRCAIALRLRMHDGEPLPTTEIALVRICDRGGPALAPIGEVAGICQHDAARLGTLLEVRCGWPGLPDVKLDVIQRGTRLVVEEWPSEALPGPSEALPGPSEALPGPSEASERSPEALVAPHEASDEAHRAPHARRIEPLPPTSSPRELGSLELDPEATLDVVAPSGRPHLPRQDPSP